MKKLISIILATLMIVSMTTAFAADVTYPENLAQGCHNITSTKVNLNTGAKVATSKIKSVTSSVNSHTSFGEPLAIFNGVGMDGTKAGADFTGGNTDRWTTADKNAEFTLTITFTEEVTFNQIKFTEVKKVIEAYEVTGYKDGKSVKTVGNSFSDGSTTSAKAYLREIEIGESITVDKITFKATPYASTTISSVVSIAEMEFYDGAFAPTVTTTGTLTTLVGDVTALFDGVYDSDSTVSDGILQIRAYAPANNEIPNKKLLDDLTITFDLGMKKTFNYAELSERRCVLGTIDVQYKNADGEWVTAGTIPEMTYVNSLNEFSRSVYFDAVTARYVRFVATSIPEYSVFDNESAMRTININEIILSNYDSSEADEATIYPLRAFGATKTSFSDDVDMVNANVMIKNSGNSSKTYDIYAAQFAVNESGYNELKGVVLNTITVPAGESTVINTSLKVNDSDSNLSEGSVKYFVWENVTLTPICDAKGIPFEQ